MAVETPPSPNPQEDDFISDLERTNQFASLAVGKAVEFEAPPESADIEILAELKDLLRTRAEVNARLRILTEEDKIERALAKARQILAESANSVTVGEKSTLSHSGDPDDRDPSTSIRTLNGGLPTLGKKRR